MTSRLARISAVAVCLSMPSVSIAQIVARQGTVDAEHQFKSPMILQLPAPNLTKLPAGTRIVVSADIGRFTCDVVSVATLTVEHKTGPRHSTGKLIAEFAGSIGVPASFDRLVAVSLVVRRGEMTLGKTSAANINAEEGRSTPFRATIALDEAQLISAFSSEPLPILEITVTVRNNS